MIQLFFRLVSTQFCSTFSAQNRSEDIFFFFLPFVLRSVALISFESFVMTLLLLFRRSFAVGQGDRSNTILIDGTIEHEHRSILILVAFVSRERSF